MCALHQLYQALLTIPGSRPAASILIHLLPFNRVGRAGSNVTLPLFLILQLSVALFLQDVMNVFDKDHTGKIELREIMELARKQYAMSLAEGISASEPERHVNSPNHYGVRRVATVLQQVSLFFQRYALRAAADESVNLRISRCFVCWWRRCILGTLPAPPSRVLEKVRRCARLSRLRQRSRG